MDIGAYLNDLGQRPSVVSIVATGARFEKANLYPTAKKIQLGDRISMTTGYKGGLQTAADMPFTQVTNCLKLRRII